MSVCTLCSSALRVEVVVASVCDVIGIVASISSGVLLAQVAQTGSPYALQHLFMVSHSIASDVCSPLTEQNVANRKH